MKTYEQSEPAEAERITRWWRTYDAVLPVVYAAFTPGAKYTKIHEHAAGLATIAHGPLPADQERMHETSLSKPTRPA